MTVNVTNAIYPSTVETLSVNLTGLQEYNNYTVRVSAVNQMGASPFSDGITQITDISGLFLVLRDCISMEKLSRIELLERERAAHKCLAVSISEPEKN